MSGQLKNEKHNGRLVLHYLSFRFKRSRPCATRSITTCSFNIFTTVLMRGYNQSWGDQNNQASHVSIPVSSTGGKAPASVRCHARMNSARTLSHILLGNFAPNGPRYQTFLNLFSILVMALVVTGTKSLWRQQDPSKFYWLRGWCENHKKQALHRDFHNFLYSSPSSQGTCALQPFFAQQHHYHRAVLGSKMDRKRQAESAVPVLPWNMRLNRSPLRQGSVVAKDNGNGTAEMKDMYVGRSVNETKRNERSSPRDKYQPQTENCWSNSWFVSPSQFIQSLQESRRIGSR